MKGLETLFKPMLWVGFIGVASKVMSALGGIYLAYRFGAGQATDAYMLAKCLPIGVYLMLDSVVYNTLVPLLRRPEKTDALFRTLLILFFFFAALVSTGLYFGARAVVALLARGADIATLEEAAQLQRITAWAILYAVPSSCLKAWNACQSRYVAASIDGFVLSGALLLALALAPDHMGIVPIAIALPAAFILLLAIQALLGRAVIRFRPVEAVSALPGRYLNRLMTPLLLLNAVQQIQVLVVIAMASYYGSGAVSQVNYSYAIAQIPVGILDLVLFSTLFPFAAQLASGRRLEELRNTFRSAAIVLLVLSLPAAVWVILLRQELVDALLTRGSFDTTDARNTTALLLGHGLAIPAWVLEALGCRVLFALGQHRTYLGVVSFRMVFFFLLAPLCLAWLDLPGISVAFAGSFFAGALAVSWCVRRTLPAQPPAQASGLIPSLFLLTGTTGLAAGGTALARWIMADFNALTTLAGSGALLALIIVGALYETRRRDYLLAVGQPGAGSR